MKNIGKYWLEIITFIIVTIIFLFLFIYLREIDDILPKLCFLLAITFVILFSFIIYRRSPTEFWDWLTKISATTVSIIFGISFLYIGQTLTDDARRDQLRSSLCSELNITINTLEKDTDLDNKDTNMITVNYIQPIVTEEAIRSGLFDVNSTKNMINITRSMRNYNIITSQLSTILISGPNNPNFAAQMNNTIQRIKNIRKAIINNSKDLEKTSGCYGSQ